MRSGMDALRHHRPTALASPCTLFCLGSIRLHQRVEKRLVPAEVRLPRPARHRLRALASQSSRHQFRPSHATRAGGVVYLRLQPGLDRFEPPGTVCVRPAHRRANTGSMEWWYPCSTSTGAADSTATNGDTAVAAAAVAAAASSYPPRCYVRTRPRQANAKHHERAHATSVLDTTSLSSTAVGGRGGMSRGSGSVLCSRLATDSRYSTRSIGSMGMSGGSLGVRPQSCHPTRF